MYLLHSRRTRKYERGNLDWRMWEWCHSSVEKVNAGFVSFANGQAFTFHVQRRLCKREWCCSPRAGWAFWILLSICTCIYWMYCARLVLNSVARSCLSELLEAPFRYLGPCFQMFVVSKELWDYFSERYCTYVSSVRTYAVYIRTNGMRHNTARAHMNGRRTVGHVCCMIRTYIVNRYSLYDRCT